MPPTDDWNTWCGPTELRPFNHQLQFGWMQWRDYSGGEMTNWGAHGVDQIQWALGKDDTGPTELWPDGPERHHLDDTTPTARPFALSERGKGADGRRRVHRRRLQDGDQSQPLRHEPDRFREGRARPGRAAESGKATAGSPGRTSRIGSTASSRASGRTPTSKSATARSPFATS